jgi:[pyruvate, water dikinase]-phosphate phosphotransferase / [pyruvate, water dikinase] kinase
MPRQKRTVFVVSDGTGITAEMLGHSLLTQFEGIEFQQITVPFVDSLAKAAQCVARISEAASHDTSRPIIFSTLVDSEVRQAMRAADAYMLDFFEMFLDPLEAELGVRSTHTVGRSHSAFDKPGYSKRIEAINFTMAHDDGVSSREFDRADVILVGVSRSGKTPTSLYLALQFGIMAANYPLIPEDFERNELPKPLLPYRTKLYGLSIHSERLREVRNERRPDSQYSNIENCRLEVQQAENLMRREGIRWVNSTTKSIEEIATTIAQEFKLIRNVY